MGVRGGGSLDRIARAIFLIPLEFKDVPGLALQMTADGLQSGETDGFGFAGWCIRQITIVFCGRRDYIIGHCWR